SYGLETEWFWRGMTGWEPVSIQIWINLCKRLRSLQRPVVWDIGASEGMYSLVAKALVPQACVIAMEPLPRAFRRLIENIALNHFDVEAIEAACSDRDGKDILFSTLTSSTEASLFNSEGENMHGSPVRVTKISSVIRDLLLQSTDLIKLDVEGAEGRALVGMGNYVAEFRPTILIEILTQDVAEQLSEIFRSLSYSYWDINDDPRN